MRILLLGATGRTGKLVLAKALDAGHSVHAIVRDKGKVGQVHDRLVLFEGDVTSLAMLTNAMKGCDAIVNVLSVARKLDFPWSSLRTPETFLSDVMKSLITSCRVVGTRRVVLCTAWGAEETKKDVPGWFRWFIDHSNIGYAYRDHERQERLIKESGLEWTIVRPVGLTNKGEKEVQVSIDNNPKPKFAISRESVARFMIEEVAANKYVNRCPTVFNS